MTVYKDGFKEIGWKQDHRGVKRMQYECEKGHVTTHRTGQGTQKEPFKCEACQKEKGNL